MSQGKKFSIPKNSIEHEPDALDLLEIDRRMDALEREAAVLEKTSKLVPGRSAKLAQVQTELRQLGWTRVSVKEHVAANLYQSEIYERGVESAKRAKAEQRALNDKRSREDIAEGAQGYRKALMVFAATWKNKKKSSGQGQSPSDENGSEPE